MAVKDYFFYKTSCTDKKALKYKVRRVVDPSKTVPDLNCEVQDLLLEVVDLKQEVPDLRSGGIPRQFDPCARPIAASLRAVCLPVCHGTTVTAWAGDKHNASGRDQILGLPPSPAAAAAAA